MCAILGETEAPQDYEILCSPDDGRPVIALYHVGESTDFFEVDGTTPYIGGTPTRCPGYAPLEQSETCMKVTTAGAWGSVGDQINAIRFFDVSTNPPTLANVIYINESTDTVLVGFDPANARPCKEFEARLSGTKTSPDAYTDVFQYYSGGLAGTLVMTVTVIYADTAHANLVSWEIT